MRLEKNTIKIDNKLPDGLWEAQEGIPSERLANPNDPVSLEKQKLEQELESRKAEVTPLVEGLKQCKKGRTNFSEYEDICEKVLKIVLKNDFTPKPVIERKVRGTVNLEESDVAVEIKDMTVSLSQPITAIWNEIREYKKFEKMIIDCKNKSNPLDSQDILQMYTYMNPEKDFGVFLWRGKGRKIEKGIAERGYNKLRDTNKYRIVILTEKDFLDWIDYYIEHGNSNEYIRENIYSKI